MAVEISRQAPFGPGSRGFRFEVRQDKAGDRKIYKTGMKFESARLRTGSLGQKIFERLSANGNDIKTG
jgi:hypothetical protein